MSRTLDNRRLHNCNWHPTFRPSSTRTSNWTCSKSTPAGFLGTRMPRLCPQACSRAPKRRFPDEAWRSNEASVSINRRPFAASRLRTEPRTPAQHVRAPGTGGFRVWGRIGRISAENRRPAPTAPERASGRAESGIGECVRVQAARRRARSRVGAPRWGGWSLEPRRRLARPNLSAAFGSSGEIAY